MIKVKLVSHRASLTAKQVRWARRMHISGKSGNYLAEKLNTSKTTISLMLSGKTYRNVK